MKSFLWLTTCSTAIAFGLLSGRAIAANFTFTKIADTTDGFSSFFDAPALNDKGTVAFSGTLSNGITGVFTGSGSVITPIAISGDTFQSVLTNPAINTAGTVAFEASTDSPRNVGIFTSSGNGLTTIATLNNSTLSDSSRAPITPALNDRGTLVFGTYTINPNSNPPPYDLIPNVFISDSGKLSTIDLKSDVSGAFPTVPNSIAINNANTVVFSSGYGGSQGYGGLFAKVGDAPLITLATSGFYPVSLNNEGTYAAALLGAGGSSSITIANINGKPESRYISGGINYNDPPSSTFLGTGSINDQDRVVFLGGQILKPGSPQSLSFVDVNKITNNVSATDADKIIATGDSLFGSTVTALGGFSPRGLNNFDQVVFYSQLADGRTGIFRAEPVPEPQTVIPSVVFLLGFGVRQMMKRRTALSGRR